MNIHEWQTENNISNKDMARMLGVHVSYLTHLKNNPKRRVSPELALKVEKITKGSIKLRELLFPKDDKSIASPDKNKGDRAQIS
ncbi:MAG: helix-turn-helix protein [Pelotomaculum sp. PtaB.Bin104]|nr:MAG: helix-turn-helix protein [Pelotomaculum sp. PtaB.Bin104]